MVKFFTHNEYVGAQKELRGHIKNRGAERRLRTRLLLAVSSRKNYTPGTGVQLKSKDLVGQPDQSNKARTPDNGAKSKACLACGLTFGFACQAMDNPAASSIGISLEPSPMVMSSESSIPC